MDAAKAFQRKKHAAGFAGITWPVEWGGQGGSPIQQVIYSQEEAKYKTLTGMFGLGLGMCIPTICRWGTQEQRDRFAPPALRGDEVWCQFFSEPAGGSDLGALRTRADRDGDEWVINGQKIWTSMAHKSDWGVLIARSDFDRPKHEGLTFFYLSAKSPGIEMRPIKQMSGASHFNEVFFNDVRIPDSQRLGPVGGGWKVAISLLMSERYATPENPGPDFEELWAIARDLELDTGPAIDDAGVQERLAEFYVKAQGLRFTKYRTMTALSKGETPGPGGVHRQARECQQAAGDHLLWPRTARRGGGDGRRRDAARRAVRGGADLRAGDAHCGGHGRDPAQHHRRARAQTARRHAGRQGDGVQGHPDRRRTRMSEVLLIDHPGEGVRRLTMNRPEKRNALNNALRGAILEALVEADQDASVKVTVLRGAGPSFSAGYDLSANNAEDQPYYTAGGAGQWARHVVDGWTRIWDLAKPVIAQVHGYCLAGGSELAACCDLVYVAEDAKIGYPPTRLMSPPDNQFHPWLLGLRRAMEMYLTGDAISGVEAAADGFANRAYPAERLDDEVLAIAGRVALTPTELNQINKRSIHRAMEIMGLRAAIRSGTELQALAFTTKASLDYRAQFKRDGGSVRDVLSARDRAFGDYRERNE